MSTDTNIDHSKKRPALIAYSVRDGKDGQKGRWTEIGCAWIQKDSKGFSLQLHVVPLDGRVILREPDTSK